MSEGEFGELREERRPCSLLYGPRRGEEAFLPLPPLVILPRSPGLSPSPPARLQPRIALAAGCRYQSLREDNLAGKVRANY